MTGTIAILLMLSAVSLAGQLTPPSQGAAVKQQNERLAQIRQDNPCRPVSFAILRSGGFPERDACSLVVAALRAMATEEGRALGLVPADTARVEAAGVAEIRILTEEGIERRSWWLVSLILRERVTAVDVEFDKSSRRISMRESARWDPKEFKPPSGSGRHR